MRARRRLDEQFGVIPLVDLPKRTLACTARISGCARGRVRTVEDSYQSCPASHTALPGPDGGPPVLVSVRSVVITEGMIDRNGTIEAERLMLEMFYRPLAGDWWFGCGGW